MKLSEITNKLTGKLHGTDVAFDAISIDTRSLKPGELFIALEGPQFDGHNFIQAAKEKGACAVLVNRLVNVDIPQVQVADTRLALGKLGVLRRQQFPIPMIALTGSCGKTTVKEMLRSILSEHGTVLASQGNLNNDYGVPLTLWKLNNEHQYAVIEMGANHIGEIAYVTNLAKPNVAIINNVAPAHIEGFGSEAGVARAKAEIFQGLPENGVAVINADDKFADFWRNLLTDKKVFTFGIKNTALFTARDMQPDEQYRFSFTLQSPMGEIAIRLPLPGQHQVMNALACAAAAQAIAIPLTAIKAGLEKMQPVPGRLMLREGLRGARIFDDSYNANPGSVSTALHVLAQCAGERVFVMGDMRELGENAQTYHAEIGSLAKQLGIQRLYAYGDLTRFTVEAFGDAAYYFKTQPELIKTVTNILQPNMTVLVKGSLSMKMKDIVAALVRPKD